MIIRVTNRYLNPYDFINTAMLSGRNYIEIDGIRLVCDDGNIVGWYNPGEPEQTETGESVPSEVTA